MLKETEETIDFLSLVTFQLKGGGPSAPPPWLRLWVCSQSWFILFLFKNALICRIINNMLPETIRRMIMKYFHLDSDLLFSKTTKQFSWN